MKTSKIYIISVALGALLSVELLTLWMPPKSKAQNITGGILRINGIGPTGSIGPTGATGATGPSGATGASPTINVSDSGEVLYWDGSVIQGAINFYYSGVANDKPYVGTAAGVALMGSSGLILTAGPVYGSFTSSVADQSMVNLLAKLGGSYGFGYGFVVPATTADTDGVIGIVHGDEQGAINHTQVALSGLHNCVFDGANVAGNYVVASTTIAGNCHDAGVAGLDRPAAQIIGISKTSNGVSGTYPVIIKIEPGTRNTRTSLVGITGSIGGSFLAVGTCSTGTATVTGAFNGNVVVATSLAAPIDGMYINSYVSNPDEVTVKACAVVAGTPTASLYVVRVLQ